MSAVALLADAVFAPWHRSGRVHRNAFAVAHAAHRLGLVTSTPRRLLFVAVYLVPVFVAVAVLAAIDRRRRIAAGAAAFAGLVGFVAAIVLLRVTAKHQVGPEVACMVAPLSIASGARLIFARSTP